jgi:hypothetical protein
VWADLSAISGAPVVPMFCLHQPGGRYALIFDPPSHPDPISAVPRYLARLESLIAAHPGEAVAHLTWPCYQLAHEGPIHRRTTSDRIVSAWNHATSG